MKGLSVVIDDEGANNAQHDGASHERAHEHGRAPRDGQHSKSREELSKTCTKKSLHEHDVREEQAKSRKRIVVEREERHGCSGRPVKAHRKKAPWQGGDRARAALGKAEDFAGVPRTLTFAFDRLVTIYGPIHSRTVRSRPCATQTLRGRDVN